MGSADSSTKNEFFVMGFAVLHIEKGTAGKAGGLGNHIDRKIKVPNADPTLMDWNHTLVQDGNVMKWKNIKEIDKGSLQKRINARIEQGYKGKRAIRKDAVTHLNIILTGSHEEMKTISSNKDFSEWLKDNYHFVCKQYGKENIVDFTLHMDERTPHLHCVVVPLTSDGRLSAKEVMGNRDKMTQLQDDYGNAMQKFNLQRGIKGSKATHDSIKEFYGRLNNALGVDKVQYKNIASEVDYVGITETPPLIGREKWVETQNKAISDTFSKNIGKIKQEATEHIEAYKNDHAKAIMTTYELRQKNKELQQIIKAQDKKLNPEKYTNTEKQTTGKSKGLGY